MLEIGRPSPAQDWIDVSPDHQLTEFDSLPSGWAVARLSEVVAEITAGDWGQEVPQDSCSRCRVLRATDFLGAQRGDVTGIPVRFLKLSKVARIQLKAGDTVVEMSGGSKAQPTGRMLLVPECLLERSDAPLVYSNFLKRLRFTDRVAPEFASLYWLALYQAGRTRSYENHTTGIRNFKLDSFLSATTIPIPPLPEQRAIARVLRTVQRAREATDAVIAATRALKQSLMRHLFTYGPVPIDQADRVPRTETNLGEIPAHWDVTPISELCVKTVDCPHSTPKFEPSGILVVRNFNIRDGHLVLERCFYTSVEEYTRRIAREEPLAGDVLFSREAPIGEACLVPVDTKLSMGQRMMLLRTNPRKLNNVFLVYTFYSERVRSEMLSLASGVTAKHLNVADVRRLPIPVPSLQEQVNVGRALATADEKIHAEEARKRALDSLFNTLLHDLMTGRRRVHELEVNELAVVGAAS